MGRKPKDSVLTEEVEVQPSTSEDIEETTTIDTTELEDSSSTITTSEEEVPIEVVPKRESIESTVAEEMSYAMGEIERCNDYVYAKADCDRRFTVYRDELYEYRYKLRQLVFNVNYPYIDSSSLPQRPDYIPDV